MIGGVTQRINSKVIDEAAIDIWIISLPNSSLVEVQANKRTLPPGKEVTWTLDAVKGYPITFRDAERDKAVDIAIDAAMQQARRQEIDVIHLFSRRRMEAAALYGPIKRQEYTLNFLRPEPVEAMGLLSHPAKTGCAAENISNMLEAREA